MFILSSVQLSRSVVSNLCDSMNRSIQASPSITNSGSSPKLMSIESVMPPAISSSVVPFYSCPQSLPASESFPIWIPFISFSSLIAMAKTLKTMLNSSGESGHPCLVLDFRGNAFNFSPLRIMAGLSYMAFIMLRSVPSIPAFWRVLS